MNPNASLSHRDTIVDQFSQQALPFSLWRDRSQDEAVRLLLRATRVTQDDTVLDVACGPGLVALAFAAVARYVTGLDVTPPMIERARALQADRGLRNVAWIIGDAVGLPFVEAAFSVVICRYALHHILEPAAVVAEMVRVCPVGGRVALVDVVSTAETEAAYNRLERLRDPSHVRALRLDELLGLARDCGLADVRVLPYSMDIELETLLQASFPEPEDAARVRATLIDDLGRDRLGVKVHRMGTGIHVSYPIALVVGGVPERRSTGSRHPASHGTRGIRVAELS